MFEDNKRWRPFNDLQGQKDLLQMHVQADKEIKDMTIKEALEYLEQKSAHILELSKSLIPAFDSIKLIVTENVMLKKEIETLRIENEKLRENKNSDERIQEG